MIDWGHLERGGHPNLEELGDLARCAQETNDDLIKLTGELLESSLCDAAKVSRWLVDRLEREGS